MSPRSARRVGQSSVTGLPEPEERLGEGLRALKGLWPYLWPRDSVELRLRVPFAGTAPSHPARASVLANTMLAGTAEHSQVELAAELRDRLRVLE